MCILFIYHKPDATPESYRLILASNRDEDFNRPTLPAHYWKNYPQCFGGCDMEPGKEGGTWLGISLTGKAGVVLNLANETNSSHIPKQGRGFLVPNFITSKDCADTYLDRLYKENKDSKYNPFVLVLINLLNGDVQYLSSSQTSIGPGLGKDNILAFGNSGIDVPYKKVEAGKEIFRNIVNNCTVTKQANLIEELITFLKSTKRYLPDPELRRRCPTMYKELSSIFVAADGYCTRTHSVLLVNGNNEVTFIEETLMPNLTWTRQVFNEKLIGEN